jgi:Fic family protein
MEYLSVAEIAKVWNISERSVRNYCSQGRVPGAFLTGKTWNIPKGSTKPTRIKTVVETDNKLLNILRKEKSTKLKGGIYHKTQVNLTYNSNHIEGSKLTEEQIRHIFETNTIGIDNSNINVDDIIETSNHFRCIDFVIDNATEKLSEKMIKELHFILKVGTSDSRKDWFNVGAYKKLPNEVAGEETTHPNKVSEEIKTLLGKYNSKTTKSLEDIIDFHYNFEKIHPFQDGNGRVGRLIMFKECLANNITPFIITNDLKLYYYRGLKEWNSEKGYLTDTILTAQDKYKQYLKYFEIDY